MFFNIFALLIVLGGMYVFLTTNTPDDPKQNIEFKPQTWLNAVRNVPTTDYGQTPQTETRGSIQGVDYRGSAAGV